MTVAKKSDACSATLSITDSLDVDALAAALATEEFSINVESSTLTVQITANNISDLRARLNTALRSVQAASEALIEVDRSA